MTVRPIRPVALLPGALLMTLSLAACTPGDLATLRQVTVEDGAAYIRENHDWRAELREMQRAMVRETVSIKKTQCQALLLQARFDAALACLRETGRLMEEAYPPLATIQALRESSAAVNELRRIFRDPAPAAARTPGAAPPIEALEPE